MSCRGVRRATVIELFRVGIEGEIDTQRSADYGDLCHDVAFASIRVALLADSALDFRGAFCRCGERVFEDCVAFFDDVVRKCVLLRKSEALSCRLFRHNLVVIELFAQ